MVVLACVIALLGSGCGTVRDFLGQPEVFDSAIEPLTLQHDVPAYTAAVRGSGGVRREATRAGQGVPGASALIP